MERRKVILLATSDVNYDQRLQKVAVSLSSIDLDVLLIGRQRIASQSIAEMRYNAKNLHCLFNQGVLFYLEINLRFFLKLIWQKLDVVCANDPDTLPAALLLRLFKRCELMYDSHEYFTEVPELEGKLFKKSIWSFVEKLGVRHAKKCYTVNESLAKIFKEKYQKEFSVVRNAPRLEVAQASVLKKDFILYQGALNKGRGLENLLRAMVHIDAELCIAGEGDLSAELLELAKELKLLSKVQFLGMVHPTELRKITREAKIGINILEANSLNYYYSLANKVFDYMHAGVPSINMAFPEYELLQNKKEIGVLIHDISEESLIKAISTLIHDEALYKKLVVNCFAMSKLFNWEQEEQKLLKLYS